MKLEKTHTASNKISCITKDLIIGTTNGFIDIPNYLSFQSHTPSFDYLESSDILEKINCIEKIDLGNNHTNLLTSNDKQIKLFTIRQNTQEPILVLDMKDTHQYSINDISQLPGTHNFLSIDYLQLKMSNIEFPSYTMLNIKPDSIDNLKWLFTCLTVKNSNLFAYGTSNGNIFLNDLRLSPYSQTISKMSEDVDDMYKFIGNISIEKNNLYVRNMRGVSIFDLRMNDLLKSYELLNDKTKRMIYCRSDCYDRIQLSVDDGNILTGSYDNKCYIIDGTVKEVDVEGAELVQNCVWYEKYAVVGRRNVLNFYK